MAARPNPFGGSPYNDPEGRQSFRRLAEQVFGPRSESTEARARRVRRNARAINRAAQAAGADRFPRLKPWERSGVPEAAPAAEPDIAFSARDAHSRFFSGDGDGAEPEPPVAAAAASVNDTLSGGLFSKFFGSDAGLSAPFARTPRSPRWPPNRGAPTRRPPRP